MIKKAFLLTLSTVATFSNAALSVTEGEFEGVVAITQGANNTSFTESIVTDE